MRNMVQRKGALIGYGFIAENGHMPAYAKSRELEIVAIADGCAARRDAAKRAMPNARIYEDHRQLLAHEPGLEFVDITTPPYAHAEIAHAALDAKLHVICEKPLATSVDDARSLVAHAENVRRVLFPVQNYRHAPVIRAVRQILDEGLVGKVHQVTLSTFRSTHARGVKEWDEHWRRERRLSGGGIAMDHGSHTFYLAFDWLASYPTAVTATMASLDGRDTEDLFTGTLIFPTGTANIHLSWTAGDRKVIYTLHGDRGAIRVEDDDIELAVKGAAVNTFTRSKWSIASEWMNAGHAEWFESMFQDFSTAVDRRDYAGRPAQDALRCIELTMAAYRSAEEGSRLQSLERSESGLYRVG